MPVPKRIRYSDAIEPLVQFIEETPPAEIVDRTLDKLRAGTPTQTMLTASALAVDAFERNAARSSRRPAAPAGGPLRGVENDRAPGGRSSVLFRSCSMWR